MRVALLAISFLLGATQARAQDATWTGRMRCDPVPGMTAGPLNAPVSVTVSGSTARYEREVQTTTGQVSGLPETGQGPVAGDGTVRLEGRVQARAYSYAAHYAGQLAGRSTTLRGAQDWSYSGRNFERPCTLTLDRR